MEKTFFSTPELAQLLGVFHTTVRRWIEQDHIRGVRVGRNYKIPVTEVIRVLDHYDIPLPETLGRHVSKPQGTEGLSVDMKASGSILEKLLIVDRIKNPALLCRRDAVVAANEPFANLVGHSQADLIGLAIGEVIDKQSEERLKGFFQRRLKDLQNGPLECTVYWNGPSLGRQKSKTIVNTLDQVSDIVLLVLRV